MIEDSRTVARLMDQMQAHLPMPAFPTKEIDRILDAEERRSASSMPSQ